MLYAEVIIPLALDGTFHYILPENLAEKAAIGMRCIVPFGSKRYYTGIIIGLTDKRPNLQLSFKRVMLLPDDQPTVTATQIELWQWLSAYYICSLGEVLRTALPAALLPESHTIIHYNQDFEADSRLSSDEQLLLDILESGKGKSYTLDVLQKTIGKRAIRAFTNLIERGAIHLEEELKSRYKPKTEVYIRLGQAFQSEEALSVLADELQRAPRQQALLLHWMELISEHQLPFSTPIPQKVLCKAESHATAALNALKKKEIFISENVIISRLESIPIAEEYKLWQQRTQEEVKGDDSDSESHIPQAYAPLPKSPLSLLYTHDFRRKEKQLIDWIEEVVSTGGQVLFLSPEANKRGLSDSLSSRIFQRLGSHLLVFHAFESDAKRVEIWNKLASSADPCVVLGVRSALFLPFQNLRLIIVDEEQEYLYKQQDPSPRFHSRKVAAHLGELHRCPVTFASVTPSAEILFLVRTKACELITWPDDHLRPIFELETINMEKMRHQRRIKYNELLSPPLTTAIEDTIRQDKMAVILQNRRGFAPYIICRTCGEKLKCIHCDVSLTYHKYSGMLTCHYCGYSRPVPPICPSCKHVPAQGEPGSLEAVGYGAERIEEELKQRYPDASILRMDSDMALSKRKMEEALGRLESNEVDILVGTQLIKGQPYNEQAGLVAVTQLDSILGYPDFRAYERAFQLLYQLMLRSRAAKLLVQTNNPDNPFLEKLRNGDYKSFISQQLQERQLLSFPPYSQIIRIEFRASDEALTEKIAQDFASDVRLYLPEVNVSSILTPPISRLRNAYIRELSLRLPISLEVSEAGNILSTIRTNLSARKTEYKRARIRFDVDPL